MKLLYIALCLVCSNLVFAESNLPDTREKTTQHAQESPQQTPVLENFKAYNEFLQAVYLYQQNEEKTLKPDVIINLPSTPQAEPEPSTFDPNQDVTGWGEEMPKENSHNGDDTTN